MTDQRFYEITDHDFLKHCVLRLGLAFHPDTDFHDYIQSNGKRVYSIPAANMLNNEMLNVFDRFEARGLDIYEYVMNLPEWQLAKEELEQKSQTSENFNN